MAASLSGVFNLQQFTDLGALGVGMRLYTYIQGTTTHKIAYTDQAGTISHTYTSDGSGGSYIALNARGELPAPLYLTAGSYDLALKTATGATVWTRRADPVYADLAATTGAALVGYDGSTAADALNALRLADYTALRAYTGSANSVYVRADGVAGFFRYDSTDTTSADNGGTIIVASNGKRWKRVYDGPANLLWFGVDRSGVTDGSTGIQAWLNLRGDLYAPSGTFKFSVILVVYGNTRIEGAGPGVTIFKWYGATSGNIIQDSSRVTSTDINLNIELSDFELDCNTYAVGTTTGINFWRVGKSKFHNLYIHDCGASLFNYGVSHADTVDIEITKCRLSNARTGDGVQGYGRRVSLRDNYAYNIGDTAYAVLGDASAVTNPTSAFIPDVVHDNCVAEGTYNDSGVYVGTGRVEQLGFAAGPAYAIGAQARIVMQNCKAFHLYTNAWFIVFDGLWLEGNDFRAHANTLTGGVRLDGVRKAKIQGNDFELSFASGGADYSALLLKAQRNIYGAFTFDASNKSIVIDDNTFTSTPTGLPAIALTVDPAVSVTQSDMAIGDNTFVGINKPIQMLPASGSGTGLINRISVNGNTADSSAVALVTMNGATGQYVDVNVKDNPIGTVPPVDGAGSYDVAVTGTNTVITAGVADGVATTVYAMPAVGFHTMQITCYVQAANDAFTAIAVIVNNAGDPRIAWQSNGANCTITLSGVNVQVTQSGIGAQTVRTTVKFLS